MYFFAHHYLLFLVAESIDAIGTTFGNGAIDAWAVDALDTAGFTGGKDRIFSRMSQLTNTGWLLSAMVGVLRGQREYRMAMDPGFARAT